MANHKRKKSKRNVKCTICTTHRWQGNGKGRFKVKETANKKLADKDIEKFSKEKVS